MNVKFAACDLWPNDGTIKLKINIYVSPHDDLTERDKQGKSY